MILDDLFHTNIPYLEFLIRGIAVYLFVLIVLRIGGKRQIAQMSPTEFVAMLLISNAVQNSMNGGDNSLTGGFILAAVLVATSVFLSYITYKSHRVSRIFEGTPTLIIHNGKLIDKHLHRERITKTELWTMLRRQNVHSISDVQTAILEPDGTFSVTLTQQ